MQENVHPERPTLIAFADGRLDTAEIEIVAAHVRDCEFCREFCDEHRLLKESTASAAQVGWSAEVADLAYRLYRQALTGQVISLTPLRSDEIQTVWPLAADGKRSPSGAARSALTLFSEEPEIVLRVMRGAEPQQNHLQLVADDPSLVSHVLIQAPQLGLEYLTDHAGRAELGEEGTRFTSETRWQLKMPDAVFDLEPLVYDPDKTEYSEQVVLETRKQDKIEVTWESKVEGKKLSVRILALDGRTDFGEMTVALDQERSDTAAGEPVVFDLAEPDKTITIRLFAK